MHYLVVSPTPLFPATAGNRSLVLAMVRQIRAAGHRISFLYSVQEEEPLSDEARVQTLKEVDALYVLDFDREIYNIANLGTNKRHLEDGELLNYRLDDWHDVRLETIVREIYAREPFEVMLSNYIWMSKLFECVPSSVVKIQQTHDKMSNRMQMLITQGLSPTFFSVPPEEEGRGLDRADINIALQYSEELYFRTLTQKPVYTLQHEPGEVAFAPRALPLIGKGGRKLRVGFVGSKNSINIKTLVAIIEHLDAMPEVAQHVDLHIVGRVGEIFKRKPDFVTLVGTCADIGDFYRDMDVVVNPVIGGTGLKIKSVEALQHHVPLIVTTSGGEGLLSPYHFHRCASIREVLGYLKMIADNSRLLPLILTAGEQVLRAYRHRLAVANDVLAAPHKILAAREKRMENSQKYSCSGREFSFYMGAAGENSLPDLSDIEKLKPFAPTDGIWVDIGSANGAWAVIATHEYAARKMIVVEFDPDFSELIKLNVIGNRMQDRIDMRLLGFAAGAAPGYGRAVSGKRRSDAVYCDTLQQPQDAVIPFIKIDEFLNEEDQIDVIHLAAENPLVALEGAEIMIDKFQPLIVMRGAVDQKAFRVWADKKNYASRATWVNSQGTEIFVFAPVKLSPHA